MLGWGWPGLFGGFGVEFVELFFEAVLLLESAGGFLRSFFKLYHFGFDCLDALRSIRVRAQFLRASRFVEGASRIESAHSHGLHV